MISTDRKQPFPGRSGQDDRQGKLMLDHRLAWTVYHAKVEPIAGWYSPRFGSRVPATSLIGRGFVSPSISLTTELELP